LEGGLIKLVEMLRTLQHPMAICFEASCGYGHLHDLLSGVVQKVVVAHPGQLRLIFKSKRKNDRVDAKKLATLLLLDQVPEVHVPNLNVREWRSLIEFRGRLVRDRTQVKNRLRSLFKQHGVLLASGKRLWTKKGVAELSRTELPGSLAKVQRDVQIDLLTRLSTQIQRVELELNTLGVKHPGVTLLRSIPGVGPRTAEAVVAYIDQPGRFHRNKNVGSYFGLVPCQDQSADRNRMGHITREGPATVRKLVTEASWQGIRRSPHLRAYFERIQKGDSLRKRIALLATSHYLIRSMLAMLKSGELWRHDQKGKKAKQAA